MWEVSLLQDDHDFPDMAATELQEITEMAFEAYGKQLEAVPSFKYLGRIMTAGDDDWLAVLGNLGKARKSWG